MSLQVIKTGRARARRPAEAIDVSIVIPVRDEARSIRSLIEGIYALDSRGVHFEVIVVDGLSRDRTRAIVRELQGQHPGLRLYSNPRQLASAARNIGVRRRGGGWS